MQWVTKICEQESWSFWSRANPKKQQWLITDVVGTPVWDEGRGPLNATMLSKLKNTEVKVLKDRVNAFRLKDVITDFNPDILVSFGTWRNVLHDSIIDDDVSARPSQAERVSVQGRQTKIFNVGEDFLVAVSSSVLAQTAATYLTVGQIITCEEMLSEEYVHRCNSGWRLESVSIIIRVVVTWATLAS